MFKITSNRLLNYKFRSKFYYKKKSSITGFNSTDNNNSNNSGNNTTNNSLINDNNSNNIINNNNKKSKHIKYSTQDILSSLPDPTNKNWKSKIWFTIDKDNQLIDELLKDEGNQLASIKNNHSNKIQEENYIDNDEFSIQTSNNNNNNNSGNNNNNNSSSSVELKSIEKNEKKLKRKDKVQLNNTNDNKDEIQIEDEIERMERELNKLKEIKRLKQKQNKNNNNEIKSTSKSTTPEPTILESTIPESTISDSTVSESSISDLTISESTISESTISESSISDLTISESTKPASTTTSNHLKGKSFELKTVEIFNGFGMNLKRTGGRDDKGKDFEGYWILPGDKRIRIIGQCKNFSEKKVGPSVLREFDSTIQRYKVIFDEENKKLIKKDQSSIVGIISSSTGFSPSIKSFAEDIQHPIILCQLTNQGIISFHLNSKAKSILPNLFIARRKQNNNNNNNHHHDSNNRNNINNHNNSIYTLELFYH